MNAYHTFLLSAFLILSTSQHISAMEKTEFDTLKQNLETVLSADVISPATWNSIVKDLTRLDQQATPTQRNTIHDFLSENASSIENTVKNTVISTLSSAQVKKIIAAIAMGTIYGSLPSVGFKALAILTGNLDLASAGTQLVDVAILSALDSFVRYAEEKGKTSPEMGALQSGMISTAVQQFIGYQGVRPTDIPLLGPAGRPLINGLQSLAFSFIHKELQAQGGTNGLLQKINWQDIAQGPENQQTISQYSGAYDFIKNNLFMIIQNETVRSAIATTVTYAVEGAVVGAVMHSLGLGFYNETLPTALGNAMARGALEGLYNFSQYGEQHLGTIQRLKGGFATTTVQRYMQSGVGVGILDITPVVVQQVTSSAITGIVRQAGGWANTFQYLYSTGKKAFFG